MNSMSFYGGSPVIRPSAVTKATLEVANEFKDTNLFQYDGDRELSESREILAGKDYILEPRPLKVPVRKNTVPISKTKKVPGSKTK